MIVIGVTGLICSGKTVVSSMFKRFGAGIFDADKEVEFLYRGNLLQYVKSIFPEAVRDDVIDKKVLAEFFLSDDARWSMFERHIHKSVLNCAKYFIKSEIRKKSDLIVLDVPLLMRSRIYKYCNIIIRIKTSAQVGRQRSGARNINRELYNFIHSKQLADYKNLRNPDFVINNGLSKGNTFMQVKYIIEQLSKKR